MSNWKELEKQFAARLSMSRRPVAVTFLDTQPEGIEKFSGTEPAGCSFWRLAEAGRAFYTVPADHFNCAVGAYTHNVHLPPERVQETEAMLGTMFNLGYIRPEEVPGIPRLSQEPAAIVFAPLGDAPVAPNVVLFTCHSDSAMLHGTVTSLGCIGNRIYTGLGDGELYVVVPGAKLEAVSQALGVIATANATLEEFARGRQAALYTV